MYHVCLECQVRCYVIQDAAFFINQEVRRQLLINAIFVGDWTLVIAATRFFFTQSYITCKVRWYSSRRLPRNSARPPSEFSWQHSPHCCKRVTKPPKTSSGFGTDIIWVQSLSKIALIKSCRLTSSFMKHNYITRGARDTDIEFMNCTIEEVISIARSMI